MVEIKQHLGIWEAAHPLRFTTVSEKISLLLVSAYLTNIQNLPLYKGVTVVGCNHGFLCAVRYHQHTSIQPSNETFIS